MKRSPGRYLAALLLLLLNGAAMFFFRRFPGIFFPAYRSFSKAWIGLLARLTSFTGLAVWDIAAVVLVVLLLGSLVHVVRRHRRFTAWLGTVLLCVSVLITSAVCGWMLNHYAPPLAGTIGLDVGLYSVDELAGTAEALLREAGTFAERTR